MSRTTYSITQDWVFLNFKIRVYFYEVLGVLDEDVLLHPGDDFEGFGNPKFRILPEKLAYRNVYSSMVPNQSKYRRVVL